LECFWRSEPARSTSLNCECVEYLRRPQEVAVAAVAARELAVELAVSSLEASSDMVKTECERLLCTFAAVAPVVLFCSPVLRRCTTSSKVSTCAAQESR
jgi:hypothetical protein